MASTAYELQRRAFILKDFDVSIPLPIPLWYDNQVALRITHNPVFHEKTKHLKIDYLLMREKFRSRLLFPQHISSSSQLADVFTKSLSNPLFHRFLSKLGWVDLPPPAPALGGNVEFTC